MNSVTSSFKCQSYKGFLPPGCKDIGIRKYACVAKTHFFINAFETVKTAFAVFCFVDFLAFEVFIMPHIFVQHLHMVLLWIS